MKNWEERAESIKAQAKVLLEDLVRIRDRGSEAVGTMPCKDAVFDTSLNGLSKTDFNIAVCGEVSQGKSSFINALIGRGILPTNEHPTTSQLFRISRAETDSYRFVFVDGTEKEFASSEDMLRYGTVLASQETVESKVIDYIDVRLRAEDIPVGVYIWDTPGLGVSHYSHEEITARCISRCDAVIFLSQPKAVLTDKEIRFVSSVLTHTTNLCFVQTFADKFDEAVIKDIAKRNVEILEKQFGNHMRENLKVDPDFHFVACSSANLLLSKSMTDDSKKAVLFKRSRFEEVHSEIERFLFQTVCVKFVVSACSEYIKFHNKCVAALTDSKKVLTADTKAQKTALSQEKKNQLRAFEDKWNVKTGTSYQALFAKVDQIVRTAKSKASQLFSRNSNLLDKYRRAIQELTNDPNAVQNLYEEIKVSLPNEVSKEWQKIIDRTNSALYDCFAEFEAEFNVDEDVWDGSSSSEVRYKHEGVGAFTTIRNGTIGFSVVGGLTLKAVMLAPITGGWSLVAAGAAVLASAIWGAKKSIGLGAASAAKDAKNNLKISLENYFTDLNREYATDDIGKESKVSAYFAGLSDRTKKSILSVVETERANMNSACERLERQAQLEGESIADSLAITDEVLHDLSAEKQKMIALMTEVNTCV